MCRAGTGPRYGARFRLTPCGRTLPRSPTRANDRREIDNGGRSKASAPQGIIPRHSGPIRRPNRHISPGRLSSVCVLAIQRRNCVKRRSTPRLGPGTWPQHVRQSRTQAGAGRGENARRGGRACGDQADWARPRGDQLRQQPAHRVPYQKRWRIQRIHECHQVVGVVPKAQ